MEVDATEPGCDDQLVRQFLAEGDHDHQIGRGELNLADVIGADQRQAGVRGVLGDGRRREFSSPAGGAVGLADDLDDPVAGV